MLGDRRIAHENARQRRGPAAHEDQELDRVRGLEGDVGNRKCEGQLEPSEIVRGFGDGFDRDRRIAERAEIVAERSPLRAVLVDDEPAVLFATALPLERAHNALLQQFLQIGRDTLELEAEAPPPVCRAVAPNDARENAHRLAPDQAEKQAHWRAGLRRHRTRHEHAASRNILDEEDAPRVGRMFGKNRRAEKGNTEESSPIAWARRCRHQYYNNDLRGGEGHMEVGKLIMNVVHSKAHMTLSVKPFGCMPSAGVSDGVQTAISERFPGTIFCPVETSGDGRVNFYSRVQMYLFKAKQSASAELDRACAEHGVTLDQVRGFLKANPRHAGALHKAPHAYAGTAADLVAEVAPYITQSRAKRLQSQLVQLAKVSSATARKSPHLVLGVFRGAVQAAPELASRVKEDVLAYRESRRAKKEPRPSMDAAAE